MKKAEKIFLSARKDFINKDISLDDLSTICNHHWFEAIPGPEKATPPFATMLQNGGEISYYLRKAKKKESANILASHINSVIAYTPHYQKKSNEQKV